MSDGDFSERLRQVREADERSRAVAEAQQIERVAKRRRDIEAFIAEARKLGIPTRAAHVWDGGQDAHKRFLRKTYYTRSGKMRPGWHIETRRGGWGSGSDDIWVLEDGSILRNNTIDSDFASLPMHEMMQFLIRPQRGAQH
jgi:hypothetical protein